MGGGSSELQLALSPCSPYFFVCGEECFLWLFHTILGGGGGGGGKLNSLGGGGSKLSTLHGGHIFLKLVSGSLVPRPSRFSGMTTSNHNACHLLSIDQSQTFYCEDLNVNSASQSGSYLREGLTLI